MPDNTNGKELIRYAAELLCEINEYHDTEIREEKQK